MEVMFLLNKYFTFQIFIYIVQIILAIIEVITFAFVLKIKFYDWLEDSGYITYQNNDNQNQRLPELIHTKYVKVK